MLSILAILIALSLNAIVSADEVTFVKSKGRIYVQTDKRHYALFGQVKDNDGIRIIVVNGKIRYYLTSGCKTGMHDLSSQDVNEYFEAGYEYMKVDQKSPMLSNIPTDKYSWSDTISDERKEFSIVKLDEETLVFTSKYFPNGLAKVIMSGDVVIFVYPDGQLVMKTMPCLYKNEKRLIDGIKKIDTSGKKYNIFSSNTDKALKIYLKFYPINVDDFSEEQRYNKILTEKEMADIDRAVRGASLGFHERGWRGL